MRFDREVDVLIFGAGMGGMCAALFAALEGLDVLLCEKTDQVGGTTATSAGTVWIPGSSQAKRDGVPDSADEARKFLAAEIGPRAEAVREAFLQAGPAALDYLEARTEVKFRAPPRHPDYHSNRPGRALAGRALAPLPFDGRLLGADFDRVRPPIAPFMVLGGMMVGKDDIPILLKPFGSAKSFAAAAKLLLRHATDRLRFRRGTRLVMGNALVARLFYSLKRRNVAVVFDARLVELVKGTDGVEGAVVDIGDKRQTIRARRGVILATGGFAPNEKLRAEFMPDLAIKHSNAFAGASGDGFTAARTAGAAVDDKHTSPAFYFPSSLHGDTVYPHILLDRAKPGLIAVNKDGRRFVNESDSYHDFAEAMLRSNAAAPAVPAWLICDRAFIGDYGLGLLHPGAGRREIERYIADGYLYRAETLMELAQRIGVDGENLLRSVQAHNRYAETGVDEAFGKGGTEYNQFNGDPANRPNPCLRPIAEAPFFAVAVYPSTMGTCVGLATDGDARVLDENGAPLGGLYAVGNDMASLFRGVYVGPGVTLGPALVFAYRAVIDIAKAGAGDARKRITR
ncbi:MAG: FAD-dependent oxidoreductase [Alphaproteobacteria bacterium]|nr:MAG: FAD-dependent oxidoreductase [Alphaproteobacteria bacterium]